MVSKESPQRFQRCVKPANLLGQPGENLPYTSQLRGDHFAVVGQENKIMF